MKKILILFFIGFISVCPSGWASDLNVALQKSYVACFGINDMLKDMKVIAGVNTAVTGVGTVAGGGALIAGLKKKHLMENLYNIEEGLFEKNGDIPAQNSSGIQVEYDPNFKPNLKSNKSKAKKAGNWRTGLLAVNTATNVAGAVMASKNLNTSNNLEDRVKQCVDSMEELQKEISRAKFDNEDISEAKIIYDNCSQYKHIDISVLEKRARGAQISSIVGGGTGAVGVITSALANNAKTLEKEKKLDTASNVLAGGATVLTGGATVFNAIQISAIKKIADVAERCDSVLK